MRLPNIRCTNGTKEYIGNIGNRQTQKTLDVHRYNKPVCASNVVITHRFLQRSCETNTPVTVVLDHLETNGAISTSKSNGATRTSKLSLRKERSGRLIYGAINTSFALA